MLVYYSRNTFSRPILRVVAFIEMLGWKAYYFVCYTYFCFKEFVQFNFLLFSLIYKLFKKKFFQQI